MRQMQEKWQAQVRKKRRPFGSVSLVLLLDCLWVVDAWKVQGMDAYIGAESSVSI
jgi:hypothetical protein